MASSQALRSSLLVAPLQDGDHARIETFAGLGGDALHGVEDGEGLAERTVGGKRVEAIDGGQDTRADGNRFVLEAGRVSAAIPFFMMGLDDGADAGREVHARQHLRAGDRMGLHLFPFFLGEGAGFEQDVVGNAQLADVVDQGGDAQILQLRVAQAEFLPDGAGVELDPAEMLRSGVIASIDDHRKGLQGAAVEQGELGGVIGAGAGPDAESAVDGEQNRQREKRGVDAGLKAGAADQIGEVGGGDKPGQQRAAFAAVQADQGRGSFGQQRAGDGVVEQQRERSGQDGRGKQGHGVQMRGHAVGQLRGGERRR